MSKKNAAPLYTLAPNEEVLFEVNIDYVSVTEAEEEANFLANLLKSLLPSGGAKTGDGVFVVTNTRLLIVFKNSSRGFMGFYSDESRNFWSIPRRALTEWHSYEKAAKTVCCCTKQHFLITIGLDDANGLFDELTFGSYDITSDEEAQALIAKLIEVSQKS